MEINEMFKLAADLINYTSQSLFLTGKAGTGKTTFLRYIRENTQKNTIVAAPTGVAAINAGGITLHSLFQLPFEPFIPGEGIQRFSHRFRLNQSKIEMLRNLELLIIDEVSMLRADILDAVDYSLRHFRRNNLPFGGVQMLYIGDMFQLPPVAQNDEWEILGKYYESPFFFHAKSIEKSQPVYIEFKKIYRQNEQHFIDILNKIRNNEITADELQVLNEKYNPNFETPKDKSYVVLSTHNYKTDRINNAELEKLPGKEKKFIGTIKGNFSESSYPTDLELRLKKGAQVMFIKNDPEHRYYNGKLGVVTDLTDSSVVVELEGSKTEVEIMSEIWDNIHYKLNKETNKIEEEILGSFKQLPLRAAWAITIHKSQGLTFERALIDAGQAFAAGQVYVALSRCTTLDGIVLYSKIMPESIKTDPKVIEFAKKEKHSDEIKRILDVERPVYLRKRLMDAFDWQPLLDLASSLTNAVLEKTLPNQQAVYQMTLDIKSKIWEQQGIAEKFKEQLKLLLNRTEQTGDISALKERVQKAALYFVNELTDKVLSPLGNHAVELMTMSKVKQYSKEINEILAKFEALVLRLKNIRYGEIILTEGLFKDPPKPAFVKPVFKSASKSKSSSSSSGGGRPEKGSTHKLSLEMFRKGKTIDEIAVERNLTRTTIEGHLSTFILSDEVKINEIVSDEKIKVIQPLVSGLDAMSNLGEIKKVLGNDYSYGEIRAVLNDSIRMSRVKN